MKKNNLIRFAQSLVLLPMVTSSFGVGSMQNIEISQNVIAKQVNIEAEETPAPNQAAEAEAELLKAKAEAIDAYFRQKGMPLAGMGKVMAEEAEKNGLDWRLIAAIAVRESTGGKFACQKVTHSFLGWGSCKINFESKEAAIATVARNLGGNNPKTVHYYGGKDTVGILRTYNPPSIVPKYAEQVIAIMNAIGKKDMAITLAANS